MLRIYRAPNGFTYQYHEGEQPEGYVLADAPEKKPAAKKRTARNKAAKPVNKAAADD